MSLPEARPKLGNILLEAGLLTPEQLENALTRQRQTGERLGDALIALGYVTEETLLEVLEFQLGIPQVRLADYALEPAVVRLIPESLARRHNVIAVRRQGKVLTVAMSDPLNIYALDDLRAATGLTIAPALATASEIKKALGTAYAALPLAREGETEEQWGRELKGTEPEPPSYAGPKGDHAATREIAHEAPIIELVNNLIERAVQEQASDIHLEPWEHHVLARFRIDGVLREVTQLPKKIQPALISRLKVMAELDIAEKRLPQDGRIQMQIDGRPVDLRMATLPTLYGEKVVLRILDRQRGVLTLSQLQFEAEKLALFREMLARPYGMILLTGPTGSGKTTTLYAALQELNTPAKNIITVEDPVEYTLPGICQVQVNPRAGLTFATGLRAIVRQDPDVIMVGEIRDRETAAIAVQAALTGHLVLSTLHTNDAAGAVARLLEMGIEPFLVASAVIGVVAQRLVRRVCLHCRKAAPPTAEERAQLGLLAQGEEPDVELQSPLYRGQGCARCGRTGYQGRLALQEIMVMQPELRRLVTSRASSETLRTAAIAAGMEPLARDGLRKVRLGLTTVEEVRRAAFTL